MSPQMVWVSKWQKFYVLRMWSAEDLRQRKH